MHRVLNILAYRPLVRNPSLAVVLFAAVSALGTSVAMAQEKQTVQTLDDRLERVERVLDRSLLDQLQRIDGLQREIRELRGEIESLNYDLDTIKKRNNSLYADTDRRVTDLEEAQAGGSLFGAESFGEGGLSEDGFGEGGLSEDGLGGGLSEGGLSEGGLSEGGLSEDGASGESGDANLAVEGAPGNALAVIVPEGGARKALTSPADFGSGPQPPSGEIRSTATQAEKAAYTRAYELLARGENDASVAAFDEFLQTFPDGPYSDNAWYWQGEAKYAQRKFDEALRNFGVVVNSFPQSTKVPDARLKIGFSRYEQREYAEARRVLTGVQDEYAGRSAAVLARKRLQQMDREGQ